jgi:hypothetical protein
MMIIMTMSFSRWMKRFGRKDLGTVATSYLMSYVYKRRFLDTQYGMRKDGDKCKIGDFTLLVEQDGGITIKEKEFRGSEVLWELLTHNGVKKDHVTSDELRPYKKILLMTNAHFQGYQHRGVINIRLGKKFSEIIAPHFSRGQETEVINRGYAVHGKILSCPPEYYITILPNRKLSPL